MNEENKFKPENFVTISKTEKKQEEKGKRKRKMKWKKKIAMESTN